MASGLVLAFRVWVGRHAMGPVIFADEAGYLGMARLIGHGGQPWNMGTAGTYSPGYSLVLSAWYLVSHDPSTVYRAAILTNAVLGAIAVVPLWAIARRVTSLEPRMALGASVVLLVSPAVAGHANWAWAENLTVPVFLVLVLLCMRFVEQPTPRRSLQLAVAVPVVFVVHSRMLPAALVVLALLALAGIRRWLPPAWAAASVVAALAGLAAVRALTSAIHTRLWDTQAGTDQVTNSFDQLTKARAIGASAVGQGWYLLIATAGIFGLGAIAVSKAALWRRGGATWAMRRADAVIMLLLVGVTIATSVVFMAGRTRGDQLVYGRYNDAVVLPITMVGIGVLASIRSLASLARQVLLLVVVTAVAAGLLRRFHTAQLQSAFERATILGLLPFSGVTHIRVLHATAIGLIVFMLLAGLSAGLSRLDRSGPLRATVVVVVLGVLAIGAMVAINPDLRVDTASANAPVATAAVREIVPPGTVIRYKTYLPDAQGVYQQSVPMGPFYLYPFYLWQYRLYRQTPPSFRRDPGEGTPPSTPWFFSTPTDAAARTSGARIAYIDPDAGLALWVEPGPEQRRLAADGALLPTPQSPPAP